MRLVIGGQSYLVSQTSMSFAINQIPEAVCTLATGRDARTLQRALIHQTSSKLTSMLPAQVYFTPEGTFSPDGTSWPGGEILIFDGYIVGGGYQKVAGHATYVVYLQHWLIDLGFTSSLSSISVASNPLDISTYPTIVSPFSSGDTGASGTPGIFLSDQTFANGVQSAVQTDLWAGIRVMLCGMTTFEGFIPTVVGLPASLSTLKKNNRALKALVRFEGPSTPLCNKQTSQPYRYGVPLPLTPALGQATFSVAEAIGRMLLSDAVQQTMWDVLVGSYCTMFQLDICPMVDRAIVAARLPGYRTKQYWRDIPAAEYSHVDEASMIPKPLRGIVIHGSMASDYGGSFTQPEPGTLAGLFGAYASDAASDADGAILYQAFPKWITSMAWSDLAAGDTTGATSKLAGNTATTAGNGKANKLLTPSQMFATMTDVANRYAQSLFIQEVLRGRSATYIGKLRFDIAPGSHIRIQGSPEVFVGASDTLAEDRFGQVNRVTIEINAEARRAVTSFMVTHLRNSAENNDDRTSITAHPLYGSGVMLGAPLAPVLEFASDAQAISTAASAAGFIASGDTPDGSTVA